MKGSGQKRNANISAEGNVKLIVVPAKLFQQVVGESPLLRDDLTKLDKKRLLGQLFEFTPLKSEKISNLLEEIECEIINGEKGDLIFSKNDVSDEVYFIVSGSVKIILNDDNHVHLSKGQIFGELGVLNNAPRAGSAVFETDGKILKIPGNVFYDLYVTVPELRSFVLALQQVYTIPTRGKVTISKGLISNGLAIKVQFEIHDRSIVSLQSVNEHVFNIRCEGSAYTHVIRYKNDTGIIRELVLHHMQIIGINAIGDWKSLGEVCRLLFDCVTLTKDEVDVFEETGELISQQENVNPDIICPCLNLSRTTIQDYVTGGATTMESLTQLSGAGSVCGECVGDITKYLDVKHVTH